MIFCHEKPYLASPSRNNASNAFINVYIMLRHGNKPSIPQIGYTVLLIHWGRQKCMMFYNRLTRVGSISNRHRSEGLCYLGAIFGDRCMVVTAYDGQPRRACVINFGSNVVSEATVQHFPSQKLQGSTWRNVKQTNATTYKWSRFYLLTWLNFIPVWWLFAFSVNR